MAASNSKGLSLDTAITSKMRICEVNTFKKVFNYLVKLYGEPNSTKCRFYNWSPPWDTFDVTYQFSEKNQNIFLRRSYQKESSHYAPAFYEIAEIVMKSLNYEAELEKAKKDAMARLTPADYFNVQFSPLWTDLVIDPRTIPSMKYWLFNP